MTFCCSLVSSSNFWVDSTKASSASLWQSCCSISVVGSTSNSSHKCVIATCSFENNSNRLFWKSMTRFAVQYQEREKYPWRSVTFSTVAGFSRLLDRCFCRFLNCINDTKSCKASYTSEIFLYSKKMLQHLWKFYPIILTITAAVAPVELQLSYKHHVNWVQFT